MISGFGGFVTGVILFIKVLAAELWFGFVILIVVFGYGCLN